MAIWVWPRDGGGLRRAQHDERSGFGLREERGICGWSGWSGGGLSKENRGKRTHTPFDKLLRVFFPSARAPCRDCAGAHVSRNRSNTPVPAHRIGMFNATDNYRAAPPRPIGAARDVRCRTGYRYTAYTDLTREPSRARSSTCRVLAHPRLRTRSLLRRPPALMPCHPCR